MATDSTATERAEQHRKDIAAEHEADLGIDMAALDESLTAIRDEYDESYDDRLSLGSKLLRFTEGKPNEVAHEAVLQPVIRYPGTHPVDLTTLVRNKFGDDLAAKILDVLTAYGTEEASQ